MAKTAAERKAAQRERQRNAGVIKFELLLDSQELDMLQRNCALRRPGREPYDVVEYLQLLIRKDDGELRKKIEDLNKRKCGRCGEQLPVAECCLSEEYKCWVNHGWHELKINTQ